MIISLRVMINRTKILNKAFIKYKWRKLWTILNIFPIFVII